MKISFTIKDIIAFTLCISMFTIMIIALLEKTSSDKQEAKLEQIIYQDSTVITELNTIEQEIELLKSNHKYIEIIGAYSIMNQKISKPTPQHVKELIDICDCWYPDIILYQYKIESANGTSNIARKNNNLFGMKKAFARKTVRCKTFDKNGYAVYNNWPLSVIDRIMWEEEMFKKKPSRAEYIAKIGEVYSMDSTYLEKLKKL